MYGGDTVSKLRDIRTQKGISRMKLAELSGINIRTLEAYEQGAKDINGAKLKTLLKLCETLECKLVDLVDDKELLELLGRVNF
jgi:transcriptional regulator with XRE-family HTH domain